jgi:hypothetical protein
VRLPRGVRTEEVTPIIDLRSSSDAVQWGVYWDGQWHVCQRTGVPEGKEVKWRPWVQLMTVDVNGMKVAGHMARTWVYARADAWVSVNRTEKWRWELGETPKSRAFKRDAFQREGGDEGLGTVFGGAPIAPVDAWSDVGLDPAFIE